MDPVRRPPFLEGTDRLPGGPGCLLTSLIEK